MDGCDNGGGMTGVHLGLMSLRLVRCCPGLRNDWVEVHSLEHVEARYFYGAILWEV